MGEYDLDASQMDGSAWLELAEQFAKIGDWRRALRYAKVVGGSPESMERAQALAEKADAILRQKVTVTLHYEEWMRILDAVDYIGLREALHVRAALSVLQSHVEQGGTE